MTSPTTFHSALRALPAAANTNKSLLRALLVRDLVYFIEATADPEAYDPTDSDEGTITPVIGWQEKFFWYDSSDTTTAHDGITTLVTAGGQRYKVADSDILYGFSVLDKDESAPTDTTSPSAIIGDAYLVPSGASGEWSTKEDYIAIYTARGWRYVAPEAGRLIYVEDESTFYHYTAAGAWAAGFGSTPAPSESIPLSAAINWGNIVAVEDQTTNDPPASPTKGVAYIVGPSPTGDWIGQSLKVAISEANGSFTLYTPTEGMLAYDKALNNQYRYSGTAWLQSGGGAKVLIKEYAVDGVWTKPANLVGLRVYVTGGGGGGAGQTGSRVDGTDGGDSSFGSLVVAGGGEGGAASGGAAGVASGDNADINRPGVAGASGTGQQDGGDGGVPFIPYPIASGLSTSHGSGGDSSTAGLSGGAGGGSPSVTGWIGASELTDNEAVTVGAKGNKGGTAADGVIGFVLVEEYIFI